MNTTIAFALVASAFVLAGCAGARTSIVANGAAYPVSMSPAVRNADGTLVARRQRRVVGTFKSDSTAWGMLYSAVELDPTTDLTGAINSQVYKARGDAIVNLRVATSHCALDVFPIFNWLPFWPGCMNVHVRGDIVRVPRVPAPRARSKARASVGPSSPPPARPKLARRP